MMLTRAREAAARAAPVEAEEIVMMEAAPETRPETAGRGAAAAAFGEICDFLLMQGGVRSALTERLLAHAARMGIDGELARKIVDNAVWKRGHRRRRDMAIVAAGVVLMTMVTAGFGQWWREQEVWPALDRAQRLAEREQYRDAAEELSELPALTAAGLRGARARREYERLAEAKDLHAEAAQYHSRNPGEYAEIVRRYQAVLDCAPESKYGKEAQRKRKIVEVEVQAAALTRLEETKKRADELASRKDYAGAARAWDEFPQNLRVGGWEARLRKERERYALEAEGAQKIEACRRQAQTDLSGAIVALRQLTVDERYKDCACLASGRELLEELHRKVVALATPAPEAPPPPPPGPVPDAAPPAPVPATVPAPAAPTTLPPMSAVEFPGEFIPIPPVTFKTSYPAMSEAAKALIESLRKEEHWVRSYLAAVELGALAALGDEPSFEILVVSLDATNPARGVWSYWAERALEGVARVEAVDVLLGYATSRPPRSGSQGPEKGLPCMCWQVARNLQFPVSMTTPRSEALQAFRTYWEGRKAALEETDRRCLLVSPFGATGSDKKMFVRRLGVCVLFLDREPAPEKMEAGFDKVRIWAAGRYGMEHAQGDPSALCSILESNVSDVKRYLAAAFLREHEARAATAALAKSMKSDKEWRVRARAALSLGEHGTQAAMDALLTCVDTELLPEVRAAICHALAGFRQEAAREKLQRIGATDSSHEVRSIALGTAFKLPFGPPPASATRTGTGAPAGTTPSPTLQAGQLGRARRLLSAENLRRAGDLIAYDGLMAGSGSGMWKVEGGSTAPGTSTSSPVILRSRSTGQSTLEANFTGECTDFILAFAVRLAAPVPQADADIVVRWMFAGSNDHDVDIRLGDQKSSFTERKLNTGTLTFKGMGWVSGFRKAQICAIGENVEVWQDGDLLWRGKVSSPSRQKIGLRLLAPPGTNVAAMFMEIAVFAAKQ